MATLTSCKDFWEAKARENAYWYISSFGDFHNRDIDGFWNSGNTIWSALKKSAPISVTPSDVVVDIGCGIGRLSRAIAPEVTHVHGFDISAEMVKRADELNLANASFHVTQGASLQPLPDKSADIVLAYNVFQHLPSIHVLHNYLCEMVRVSRRMIVFTTIPRDWSAHIMPLMRFRNWLLEGDNGPKGIYKQEWSGIRPSVNEVATTCPVPLKHSHLKRDQWLFVGSTE